MLPLETVAQPPFARQAVVALAVWHFACLTPVVGQQPSPETDATPAEDTTGVDLTSDFVVESAGPALDNPVGLSLRSGGRSEDAHELVFSESGAGRVVAVPTDNLDQIRPVVTGFPTGPWDVADGAIVGPLDTLFLTPGKLAVGYGGGEGGRAAIRVFLLSDALQTDGPLAFENLDHEVVPSPTGGGGEDAKLQFFGLANNDKALLAAGGGDPATGWILKATLTKNKLVDLQPHIDAVALTGVGRPMAALIDQRAGQGYLLAGHTGEVADRRDSVLAFYAPGSGRLAAAFPANLYDLVDLAYCPASGNLYAVDAAWHDDAAGGIYRLDAKTIDGGQQCEAVRIAACRRPTSLAFTPAGDALYVTTFGPKDEPKQGQLLRITGPF